MSLPAAATCRPAVTSDVVTVTELFGRPNPVPMLTRTICGVLVTVGVLVMVGGGGRVGVSVPVWVMVGVSVSVGGLVIVAGGCGGAVSVAVAVTGGVLGCVGCEVANW